jgi:LuxR family transcriptional regulator, maltose regulon positive regulatory protein
MRSRGVIAPTGGRWSPCGWPKNSGPRRRAPGQQGLFEPLTDRELTILRILPTSASLRELAADLFVTLNTLKTHLRAIYRKLGAESREEAVIRAREGGLI